MIHNFSHNQPRFIFLFYRVVSLWEFRDTKLKSNSSHVEVCVGVSMVHNIPGVGGYRCCRGHTPLSHLLIVLGVVQPSAKKSKEGNRRLLFRVVRVNVFNVYFIILHNEIGDVNVGMPPNMSSGDQSIRKGSVKLNFNIKTWWKSSVCFLV